MPATRFPVLNEAHHGLDDVLRSVIHETVLQIDDDEECLV